MTTFNQEECYAPIVVVLFEQSYGLIEKIFEDSCLGDIQVPSSENMLCTEIEIQLKFIIINGLYIIAM